MVRASDSIAQHAHQRVGVALFARARELAVHAALHHLAVAGNVGADDRHARGRGLDQRHRQHFGELRGEQHGAGQREQRGCIAAVAGEDRARRRRKRRRVALEPRALRAVAHRQRHHGAPERGGAARDRAQEHVEALARNHAADHRHHHVGRGEPSSCRRRSRSVSLAASRIARQSTKFGISATRVGRKAHRQELLLLDRADRDELVAARAQERVATRRRRRADSSSSGG